MALTYLETASWVTGGTLSSGNGCYKDLTFTSLAVGDLLMVFGGSEGYTFNGGTRSVVTQSGATSAWTTSQPATTYNGDTDVIAAWATVTTAGSVTVRVTLRANTVDHMGACGVRIPAAEFTGTPSFVPFVADVDAQASATIAATSTVLYAAADWAATAPGTTNVPTGSTNRATVTDAGRYSVAVRTWTAQAAGTRAYGPSGLSGGDWSGVVVFVQEASGGGTNYTPSVADTAGLTDAAVVTQNLDRTVVDTAGLTDAVTTTQNLTRTVVDTAGLTDSVTIEIQTIISQAVTDTAGLTDAVVTTQGLARTITDAAGLTDAVVTAQGLDRAIGDPAGLTDTVTITLGADRGVSDSAGITDVVTVELIPAGESVIDDPIGLSDAVTTSLDAARDLADVAGITDSVSVTIFSAGETTIIDVAGITDTLTMSLDVARDLADVAGITDTLVIERHVEVTITDQIGALDGVTLPPRDIPVFSVRTLREVTQAKTVTEITTSNMLTEVTQPKTITEL